MAVGSSDSFQDAEKKLKITKLPDMLCLTLKRFSFDPRTSSMRKVRMNINHKIFVNRCSEISKKFDIDCERLHCEDLISSGVNFDFSFYTVYRRLAICWSSRLNWI